ncbi:MAG: porin family protein [Chitinophagaceae bacterium]
MKKTLLIFIVTACCLQITAFAQKPSVGIFGGVTQSNMHGKTGGVTNKGKAITGFTFGMMVDAPIKKSQISFQPTIQYTQKGMVTSKTNDSKSYVGLHYAEALLNFVYHGRGKNGHVFVGLGPSLAVPVPSKKVIKTDVSKAETTLVFGKDPIADYKSLDYGAHLLAGFVFRKGLFLSINYTLGIRNILPGDNPTDELRNGSLALKLGFMVNNK